MRDNLKTELRVCLVSPMPPPFGGMAIQATKLITCLEQAGIQVVVVRTNSEFPTSLSWARKIPYLRTMINFFVFWFRLRRAVLRSDVVYFLSGFFNFFLWVTYPAIILIKITGTPVVLSARGGAAREFFKKYTFWLKPAINRLAAITAPSGFLQQAFIDAFGIRPVIVPNIADLTQFHFRERVPLRPRLIVTRSLDEIYNVGCVIRAFGKVHDRYPEATLAVVGDGSQRRMLEELVAELGLKDAVVFHGRVSHDRIPSLYAENDIFVNGSNVDNLPGTVLEAYACGLPIVTTNAGGIPYIVEDRKTGLLVDSNDADTMAQRVIELLGNPALSRILVANGREEIAKYSPEKVREVLVPLLRKVAAG